MLLDVGRALRTLRHSPAFTAITVITLGIGLGATVTMFSAVNAAFLEPLPYPSEDRVVKVYQAGAARQDIRVPLPIVLDWAAQARAFEALGGYLWGATANVSDGTRAMRADMARVTRPFFRALGVAPARGRTFADAEAAPGAAPVVVISHRLWQALLAGRDDVLDQTVLIDGAPIPIVGVMPEGFAFPGDTDVWGSIEREGGFESRTAHNFDVVGRLRPGETAGSATTDLEAATRRIGETHPEVAAEGLGVVVVPLRGDLLGAQSSVVLIGLGAVLCVLLVACVNVANLMLARSVARETETSIRLSLGAGPAAIVRVVVAEAVVLAAAGAAVGVLLALAGTRLVGALTPASVTGGGPLAIDLRVLALTAAASALAAVACAALPAWRASRVDARQALATGARTVAGGPRRAMHALVGLEVALAFVLLFGAGLLGRSYARLDDVDPGFRMDGLTLARVSLGFIAGSPYADPEVRRQFWEQLEMSVADAPGVDGVALGALLPGGFSPNGQLDIAGRPEPAQAHFRLVGGRYFEVFDIPIRRGRAFAPTDTREAPQVAVINETLARVVFPGEDPIGQLISMNGMDGGSGDARIVGIVADVQHRGPALPPVAEAYFSYRQRPWRTFAMHLIIDSTMPPGDQANLVRDRVRGLDPLMPVELTTMAERMAAYVAPARFRASLIGALAGVAFLLAAIGTAGVVAYGTARRRHEIGVRLALGATPAAVTRLVIRGGMMPVAIGAAAGVLAAMSLARVLASFLFGVSADDPATVAAVVTGLLLAGLVATWLPARRAARTSPLEALRPQ